MTSLVFEKHEILVRQEFSKELERQGDSAAGFSISKDKASVDNLCQCLITITVRNCSLIFRGNCVFQFVPVASCPVTGHL